ncbi:mechanosensitive ion channel family protein [Microvirga roseola]|uniref:mechanosensitive ion channel family protein n=1 Tax=Microvirga roseola TaxID=2883126 RepID=UPI001E52F791|nr:mechanosensitive ion channel family protein [Microvirga roseola]
MNNAVEPTLRRIEGYIEGFFWILPNLGIALIVFLLFLIGAWAAKRTVASVFRRRGRDDLGHLLGGFAKWLMVVFGLLVVATIVFPSVQPADILATLGIGSVAIGFAFKDILQNWLSGLLILYRQPFRVSDQIKSGEFEGTVERIDARATLMRTYDGQLVVIPNSDIYTRAVVVRTAFPKRRSEYDVGIGYGDDLERACKVILGALQDLPGIEPDPAPEAIPWALEGSTVNIKVRWWTQPRRIDIVEAQGRVISAIKKALTENGIDMPFPTHVVLFHDQTEETDGDRKRQREGWPVGEDPPKARHLNEVRIERTGVSGKETSRGETAVQGKGPFWRRSAGMESE